MSQHNLPKGYLGQHFAEKFLTQKGYRIISKNFRCRFGELDLIATYKNTLIFIEVKTRTSQEFGEPQEAVGFYKLRSIIKVGEYFKSLHPKLPEALQIDVVAVSLNAQQKPAKIEHFENVTG